MDTVNTLCPACGTYYPSGTAHECPKGAHTYADDPAQTQSAPVATNVTEQELKPAAFEKEPEVAAPAIEDHPLFNQQNHLDALLANPEQSLDTQVGGSHYKDRLIQPVEFIHANGLGFIEGSIIKYVSRWQSKGGIEDLKKVVQYAVQLIALEARKGSK